MIHTGRDESSPFEILRVLEEANADLSHVAFGHMDRTLSKEEDLLKLARNGCYIEYDFFGIECSHFQVIKLAREGCFTVRLFMCVARTVL